MSAGASSVQAMSLDYLAHLKTQSDRFVSLLRDCDPELQVPSCPDWTADDLLWHLGDVQWFWGEIVERRLLDPDPAEEATPERPVTHEGLVAFFVDSSARLRRVLTETPPEVHVWMWADDKTVGYIRRRQAHEALIHRLDAELTVGAVTPLDADLASDGVDEALATMFGGVPDWGTFTRSGARVSVETTDSGLVMPVALGRFVGTSPDTGKSYDEDALDVETRDAPVTATVRGTAADLDAWLWGRCDDSVLAIDGDRSAFDELKAVIAQGIQ